MSSNDFCFMSTKGILVRRMIVFAVGMFIYASGIAITKNCNLGISPIVSVAYAMSLITPISLGWCTTVVNLPMFALQRILLREKYPFWMMLAQFLISVLFSIAIDIASALWSFAEPAGLEYWKIMILFITGCFVLAAGMILVVTANFVMLPAEGTINSIVYRTNMKFGNVKVLFDGTMVTVTLVLTLVFLHQVKGIREGTVIAVLLVGNFAKIARKLVDQTVKRFLDIPEPQNSKCLK